ncbi:hypothetical protein GCM10023322_70950 [Rugosimonospora acidiphila]|uniref:Tetratricopeptide repeat protein n=1 Tax=Rugosimonospora acidiphila TaxID=556531 RepID=A0ABP9SML6_9ACTN
MKLRAQVALLRVAAWMSSRYSQRLVVAALNLAWTLERAGRSPNATAAYQVAIAECRRLSVLDLRARKQLAGSLSALSYCLCRQRRHDEEIAARAEAISLWRDITPDGPELVKSLHDQAIAFHAAGRHDEAVKAWAEAIQLRAPLAASDNEHRAYLASAQRWRADSLATLGCYREALADLDASIAGYREAASVEPDYFAQVELTIHIKLEVMARSEPAE